MVLSLDNSGEGQDSIEIEDPRVQLIRRMLSHTEARQLLDHDHQMLFESNHKFSSQILSNYTSTPIILSKLKVKHLKDY